MALATITSGLNRKTMKFAHTAALLATQIELLRLRVLVALNATAANADNVFVHEGEVEAPKTAPLVISAGDTLYWDNTAKEMNKTNTNTKCGVATEDAASADTVVQMHLTNEVNL
jgi:predicted RecA/RadA family phage recombinase